MNVICRSLIVCLALVGAARADTLVPAGTSLVVTNVEELGLAPILLGSGATLAFAGAGSAEGGLNEYIRTAAGGLGTPGITSYGTWTRVTTNAFWAATNFAATSTEYIYTGRWHIPAAGLYSVYEHIDDAALIAVDGVTVLQNTSYNTPTCVRDLALTAGWHDLELRLRNASAGGGSVTNALASGLLFSPSNDLISVANQTNACPFADPGDGSVLRPVHNGGLPQKIIVTDNATFDLSEHGMDRPLVLPAGLLSAFDAGNAKVTVVGGSGELLFGAPALTVQFPPFNVDVAFAGVTDPAGVTFRDFSTVIAWPTSCAWRVADNATVALYGTNLLGTGDITLTNHTLYVLSPPAVASGATIRVQGTNLTAALKPCTLDSVGLWAGCAATLTNDISLEGVNATALFPVNADLVMQGTISGTGTVAKTGVARAEIKAPCTFVGPVSVSESGTFIIGGSTAGDSNNTVTVSGSATFALYPPEYGSAATTAWIKNLRGDGSACKVYVPAQQTLTVDTFDGALTVQASGGALHVNTLGTNATLTVTGSTAVTLDAAAPGAALVLDNGTSLTVPASGLHLDTLTLASGSIPVSGGFTVGLLGGAGRLVKQGSDTLTVNFSTNTAAIQVDAGRLTLAPPAPDTVLGDMPGLWLDASARDVFTQYKSFALSNGWINIERWNDCRPGAPLYGFNDRGGDYCQTYPYVMTGALNGRSVVSMGAYQMPLSPPYVRPGDATGIEARRLPLSGTLPVQYAIFVFGSQHGGGATVLGSNTLIRAGSTTDAFRNPATPILASPNYPVWTNGVSVAATNAGFTGGYQILSVNAKGTAIGALGMRANNTTAGGQNYGELLLYTNALTAFQRMTAEAYLAKKWGLPYSCAAPVPSATVAAGATLAVNAPFSVERLYGAGQLAVPQGAAFALSGLFTGTVALGDDATLAVPDLPPPPDASAVPPDRLTGWYDPSLTNRVVLGGAHTPSRPLAVAAVYDRTTSSRYLLGTCNAEMTHDRRPHLAATDGPWGTPMHWLDFTNFYGDANGNTLRMYRDASYINTADTGHLAPTNVQTGFIVLDSSRGGGVPITYDVNASQVFTRGNPQSVASPIWGANTAPAVRSGATYLDGTAVNGASRGYNGLPELLSFAATNAVQATFFGHYGGDGEPNGTKNRERLGEIILFETALADATRSDIEAYLMKKWLGKARDGYSDLTAATLTGNGTVTAATPRLLPRLGTGFTGSVALTGNAFTFTVSTNALGDFVAAPAFSAPGALTVPATGTLSVHFLVKPPAGIYPLLRYGSATAGGFTGWTLSVSGNIPSAPVAFRATDTALDIAVIQQGTLISLR